MAWGREHERESALIVAGARQGRQLRLAGTAGTQISSELFPSWSKRIGGKPLVLALIFMVTMLLRFLPATY